MKKLGAMLSVLAIALPFFPSAVAAESSITEQPPTQAASLIEAAGDVHFNPHGLIQIWGLYSSPIATLQSPTGQVREQKSGFLVRRSELAFGESSKVGLEWGLMVDPSKSLFAANGLAAGDNKILQDLYLGYGSSEALKVRVGQFKVATTLEGLQPSGALSFAERSWLGWRLGDRREVGAALLGSLGGLDYQVGAFNGSGNNNGPASKMKEYAGRIDYTVAQGIGIGAWIDTQTKTAALPAQVAGGGSLIWNVERFTFQAEYASKWKGAVQSGAYGKLAYAIGDRSETTIRVEKYWDYNFRGNHEVAGELGFNRFINHRKNLRLQVSGRGGKTNSTGQDHGFEEGTLALQLGF